MTKKVLTRIIIFFVITIYLLQVSIYANTLTLRVNTDKDEYKIKEKVVVTVDWESKMQAASYTIKYDSDILEFKSTNIAESFYNSTKVGEIKINWVSMNEEDFTKMTFEFIAIKKGNANILVSKVEAFADGNVVGPDKYDFSTYGKKEINIKEEITEGKIDNEDKNQANKTDKENKNEGITNNENKEDNTVAEGVMPQTGIYTNILLFVVLLIFSLIGYVKYKNLSDI